MKTLSVEEIEFLLGLKATHLHPLEILGYGYSSEGANKFRHEQPDFVPQIAAHVQKVLKEAGVFPANINPGEPKWCPFIYAEGSAFKLSTVEETSVSKAERISSGPFSEAHAIRRYIERVANPDYVLSKSKG